MDGFLLLDQTCAVRYLPAHRRCDLATDLVLTEVSVDVTGGDLNVEGINASGGLNARRVTLKTGDGDGWFITDPEFRALTMRAVGDASTVVIGGQISMSRRSSGRGASSVPSPVGSVVLAQAPFERQVVIRPREDGWVAWPGEDSPKSVDLVEEVYRLKEELLALKKLLPGGG